MKTTLLGMARSDGADGPALLPSERGGNSAADRLLGISGMTREEYLANFDCMNILTAGEWEKQKAKVQGFRLRKKLKGRVIVLGKETWAALWLSPRAAYFDSERIGETEFVLVPHPSGKNVVLNDQKVRARMRKIMRGEK